MRLWTEFITDLPGDFQGVQQHVSRTRAQEHIDDMLQMHGETTSSLGLPTIHHRLTEYKRRRQAIDVNREFTYINEIYPPQTHEQRTTYDEVLQSVTGFTPEYIISDEAAGTGSTYQVHAQCTIGRIAFTGSRLHSRCHHRYRNLRAPQWTHSTLLCSDCLKNRLVEGCVCNVSIRDDRA